MEIENLLLHLLEPNPVRAAAATVPPRALAPATHRALASRPAARLYTMC